MRILGLDEAGRGCVLGPLVVGAFCCELADSEALQEAGADDSKALSAKKRQAALKALRPLGEARVLKMTPAEIDANNINHLEEAAFVDHIRHFSPQRVYIDAPVHPAAIPNFITRLRTHIGDDIELVVEPKADANYPVVGAASIFAKVSRDAEIEALGPVGSGYPSDPVTRRWIQGFFERNEPLPPSVRTRWGTVNNLRQQTLFGAK